MFIVFQVGIVATALLTVVSPFTVANDPGFFIAIRVLEGATEVREREQMVRRRGGNKV